MRAPDSTVVLLQLTRDGRLAAPDALDRLAAGLAGATDCVLFCPGWLGDPHEVREAAERFFSLLDRALMPLGARITPARVAVAWASRLYTGAGTRSAPMVPDLVHGMTDLVQREPGHVERLLLAMAEAEVPQGPEEALELDGLLRGLRERESRGTMSPAHALSVWVMKRRAGQVGERLGREHLGPLFASRATTRLHLVGHSFGARLVTAAALSGLVASSLTLLQAAFCAFAFAADVPETERPGVYHPLLAERRVPRPITVLHSVHDRALSALYPAMTGWRDIRHGRGGSRALEVVPRSALGAVGARGVGAPTLELREALRIGLPLHPIVNIDGSRVVRTPEWLLGAHRDIYHLEIATLVAMSAGLVPGAAARLGPRPLAVEPRRPARDD